VHTPAASSRSRWLSTRGAHSNRLPQNSRDACVAHVSASANAFESPSGLALAKAERAERAERLFVHLYRARIGNHSVARTVGMANDETRRHATFDDQLSPMLGSMVRGAQENEPVRIVIAALGAKLDMVQIQENSLATTRDDAPSSIAPHDETPHGRWHVLPSAACSGAHVGG
jgi:hypothetical protein